MENSIVASYAGLLLGCIIQDNRVSEKNNLFSTLIFTAVWLVGIFALKWSEMWVNGLERCVGVLKVAKWSPGSGSELTFHTNLLLTEFATERGCSLKAIYCG
jgi:hypothetical protein